MTLNSMTGFARGAGTAAGYRWNWEIKSVNNKGLDVRAKIPFFLDGYDLAVKKQVTAKFTRGSVFVSLTVDSDKDEEQFVVNKERLKSLLDIAATYAKSPGVEPARLDGLLAIKGVVELATAETTEDERKALEVALSESLQDVLTDLAQNRADEGARMYEVLSEQLTEITALAAQSRETAGDRLEGMHKRFLSQLAKLEQVGKPVAEEKLAQEIAVMAVKADIQEELDRLDSHIEEANKLMASDKPVGRRLDFLCQEFNREANTLCSKSNDTALTKIGLELKAVIDQFREQIQNIE